MTLEEAKNILGNRAKWELKNMKRALEFMEILNTNNENKRLEAVKTMLKGRINK